MTDEQEKLLLIYREVLPSVQRIGVYPNITASSKQNPYLSLLYKEFPIETYSPSPLRPTYLFFPKSTLIHYNWLECKDFRGVVVLFIKLIPLFLFMIFGGKVIWTVHNHAPHHGKLPRLNNTLRSLFAKCCSQILVHSQAACEATITRFNILPGKILIIKHPLYPVKRISMDAATKKLEKLIPITQRPVFLMYGYIAKYKGIKEVVNLFKTSDATLIVAGKVKEQSYFEEIQANASKSDNIILIPRFITTEEEQALFSYVDGALFNFTTILTSGSLMLAGSYGTPIITQPFKSAIPDEFQVTTFETLDELSQIIKRYNA